MYDELKKQKFLELYKGKTEDELKNITADNGFTKEAEDAAKELMNSLKSDLSDDRKNEAGEETSKNASDDNTVKYKTKQKQQETEVKQSKALHCPMCGKEVVGEYKGYCQCGFNLDTVTNPSNYDHQAQEKKKKRFEMMVIIGGILFIIGIIWYLYSQDSGSQSEYVKMVKDAEASEYPGVTYGEAFENFFSNTKWKTFESEDGERVVQFSGKCLYSNKKVKVDIQFILDLDEEMLTAHAMTINDVNQPIIIMNALIRKAFEEY